MILIKRTGIIKHIRKKYYGDLESIIFFNDQVNNCCKTHYKDCFRNYKNSKYAVFSDFTFINLLFLLASSFYFREKKIIELIISKLLVYDN